VVEGIVLDVGWYRTTIRSFERELYNIPNSVFSRNVVLNVTRKNKEWRFYEFIGAAGPPAARAPARPHSAAGACDCHAILVRRCLRMHIWTARLHTRHNPWAAPCVLSFANPD